MSLTSTGYVYTRGNEDLVTDERMTDSLFGNGEEETETQGNSLPVLIAA